MASRSTGGQLGRPDDVDGQAAGPQGGGQGRALAGHALDQEDPGRAFDLDGGEADVVLQAGVGRAADLEAVAGQGGAGAGGPPSGPARRRSGRRRRRPCAPRPSRRRGSTGGRSVWAAVDVMVARTVNASPSLTWLGASTRVTAMSAPPRASTGWTSTRMPCSRSRLASVAASPSVARPSDTTTMRRRASDGRTAPARRRAPARLVREASTLVAGWTSSASAWTVSSRRASPPKKATPARAPSGWWRRASRTQSTAAACPPTPSESDPSTRNITATRLEVRGMARPARAPTRRSGDGGAERRRRPATGGGSRPGGGG